MKKLLEKASSIKTAYGKKILIALAAIIVVVGAAYAGQWYAKNKADEFAQRLHDRFISENRGLYESIAELKAKTKILEEKYKAQLKQLEDLKKAQRKEIKDVFKSGDKKAIAGFFDNVVDGYTPDQ